MGAERPSVAARVDGDALACGRCSGVFAVGLAAVRVGARCKCPHCGIWNDIQVPVVAS